MSTARSLAREGALVALVLALPAAAAGQGWIEPWSPDDHPTVRRVDTRVSVEVVGGVARVTVTERFENRGGRVAEGRYLYPLPGEAVFEGFSLFQGDHELRGELMDAERARATYEDIVRRRMDPALVEWLGSGLLSARIFPVEPGETRTVTLRYTQVLERAGNALHFRYAGSTPRAGAMKLGRARGGFADGSPGLPDGRSDAEASPDDEEADAPPETRLDLVIPEGARFGAPFSPTHELELGWDGERRTVGLTGALEGRLSVLLPLAGDEVGIGALTHRPAGEDGYFMLTLTPPDATARVEPRDLSVVLDVSGSMSGEKMDQAREAVLRLLESLDSRDRFRLAAFSNSVRVYREDWTPARGDGLREAAAWVQRLQADGGTNLGEALAEAFGVDSPPERLPIVVFLTDGLPTVGEQEPRRLAEWAETRAGRRRVFAFGVGHDVDTHLLDRMSLSGRGATSYVEPGESVERVLGLLAAKIRYPVLSDLEIVGSPVALDQVYPVRIPDLFAGETLVLMGRYAGEGGEGGVIVRGSRGGVAEEFSARVDFPARTEANAHLARLWASRKLGHLNRQVWLEGTSPALVEEIRRTALRYGLPSEYTSYLVREPDVVADGRGLDGTAPSANQASGARAVRAATEAGLFRGVRSASDLAAATRSMVAARSTGQAADGAPRRWVQGRLFALRDGVWTQEGQGPEGRRGRLVVQVEPFSSAYFAVLKALPEVAQATAALGNVELEGASLSIRVAPGGRTELSPSDLIDVVQQFRQEATPS
ncbi:MAG TPA: VIT domain-containing protein [Longimicrobiales bacterium]|jgi:Ca-activated chloride channel family protein